MILSRTPIEAAEERYSARRTERAAHKRMIEGRDWLRADAPQRVEARFQRLGATPDALGEVGLERMFGDNNLLAISYLERGLHVARTIGRIHIRTATGAHDSWGTGFLVSPQLLLTNHHVLPEPSVAATSLLELDYQVTIDGRLAPSHLFNLAPDSLYLADKELDYALVAVDKTAPDGTTLETYGWNRLLEEQGKVVLGESMNVIQHPDGQPKQVALRENRLADILDDFLHYETDTAPGASGAAVFNDQWEVVALHHSGVPRRDERGAILTKAGERWTPELGNEAIDWLMNEGVRVSRIVQHIKRRKLARDRQRQLRSELLDHERPVRRRASKQKKRG